LGAENQLRRLAQDDAGDGVLEKIVWRRGAQLTQRKLKLGCKARPMQGGMPVITQERKEKDGRKRAKGGTKRPGTYARGKKNHAKTKPGCKNKAGKKNLWQKAKGDKAHP